MRHWKPLFCLFVATWLFNSCDLLSGGGGTEAEGLSGQIVNPQGTPVGGASVRVYVSDTDSVSSSNAANPVDSTLTDGAGHFKFSGLKKGHYNVQSYHAESGSNQVTLQRDVVFNGSLNLGRDTLRTAGSIFVTAKANGSPLSGVQCFVPGSSLISISDDSGNCLITGIPPGMFKIRLSYAGLLTLTSDVLTVQSGTTTNAGTFIMVADPALAPPTPTGASAKYDSVTGIVTLNWNSVNVSDLAGYVIYRRQNLTETPSRISPVLITNTTFKDTLRRGAGDNSRILYLYQIKAQDEDGNLSALYSSPVGITAVPPAQQGQYFSLTSSTVALWTFNSKSNGNFLDASSHAFNLSGANAISLTSSPFDSAAVFTGSSYVSTPNNAAFTVSPTGKITYEARIFLSQYPSAGNFKSATTLMGMYEGLALQIRSDGTLLAKTQKLRGGSTSASYWYDTVSSAPGAVPLNRWVDVALAVDASANPPQIYGYVDEQPIQLHATPNTDPFRISTSTFAIGNDTHDSQPLIGKIDEVRVSNSLVLGQGLPLVASGTSVTTPGSSDSISHFGVKSSTVALWTFNSHSNGTFLDLGSNGFALTNASNFSLNSSPYDSAAVFTGSSTYLSYPSTTALTIAGTGQITFEARIYMTQYPSSSNASQATTLAGSYEGIRLQLRSDGSLQAGSQKFKGGSGYWYSAQTSKAMVPLNRWVDVAVAFDQSTGQAYGYIDGTPVQLYATTTGTVNADPWRTSTSAFCVGGIINDNQSFNGKIDEIRVSNTLVLGTGLPMSSSAPP